MKNREEILKEFAKLIQSQLKKYNSVNFLGYMERVGEAGNFLKPLFESPRGNMYDWVNGNQEFLNKINEFSKKISTTGKSITQKEIIDYLRTQV